MSEQSVLQQQVISVSANHRYELELVVVIIVYGPEGMPRIHEEAGR